MGWERGRGKYIATFVSLVLPGIFVSLTITDVTGRVIPAWKMFWTIFGTSNQLLAGLTLMGLTLWLRRLGKPIWITAIPAAFMLGMTLWSLGVVARTRLPTNASDPIGWIAASLMGLALLLFAHVRFRKPA